MLKKRKPFDQFDPVPLDARRVFQHVHGLASAHELSGKTGLDHKELCVRLEQWVRDGSVVVQRVGNLDCSVPVFRLRSSWDPKK